ncbi:MAG: molybdopterin-dependent oxidoreductase [Desulfuromonadales bacterium]
MINLKIDGKDVQIASGATILDAAEQLGIKIPTLCYLKKVSPTGACRICAVEIEGADKTMTACNTRAVDGMVVTTQSERLSSIRRQIVELLLVNHPLDCPVCDAGGECDLQDICYTQDVVQQPFEADDVNAATIDHWPLIQQVPNRCIMCEKCVKTCHETIGSSALFINEKGDKAFIDKDVEKCDFCGNCIQVCPTGTMISKPFKFKARPWELRKTPSVCTLCSAQCQVDMHSKQGKVMRVTAEDGATVNDGNLCVGGFFGHDYLASDRRLTTPLVEGRPASWEEALDKVAKGFSALREKQGGQALAGLTSPHLTNEENYLFQKLFRVALGSNNIDSEARFNSLRAAKVINAQLKLSGASNPLDRVGKAEAVLVFGADLRSESPALNWQAQLAARKNDANLIVANQRRVKLVRQAENFLQYRPGSDAYLAGALAKLIVDKGLADNDFLNRCVANRDELDAYLNSFDLDAACTVTGVDRKQLEKAAEYLGTATSVAIVFGRDVMGSAQAEASIATIANLALITGALHGDLGGLFPVAAKGNTQGLIDAGAAAEFLPGLQDYTTSQETFAKAWHCTLPAGGADAVGILEGIEQGQIKALYLAGANPLVGFPENNRWRKALDKLDILVAQDILANDLTKLATVVLPGAATAEKRGSVTAIDHRVNKLRIAIAAPGDARPDLAILCDLFARLAGKPAPSENAIRQEMMELSGSYADVCQALEQRSFCWKQPYAPADKALIAATPELIAPESADLKLMLSKCPFQFGTTTTYSPANNELATEGLIIVNPEDAGKLGVADGSKLKVTSPSGSTSGKVMVHDMMPAGLLAASDNFADMNIQQIMPSGSNCVAVTAARA